MKKTLIALMALAGITAAETLSLTLEDFNKQMDVIGALAPVEYTLTFTIEETDSNTSGSNFIMKFADNWGVYTQGGEYVGMDNTDVDDRKWLTPTTVNDDMTVYTWTSAGTTADTLLDSWVSKDTSGGDAKGGVVSMIVTLAVTQAGSVLTLDMPIGTTSIIETGYVVKMSDIELMLDATGSGNEGLRDISGATLTYTVPEPTTATLSLLALVGLAARRRRK